MMLSTLLNENILLYRLLLANGQLKLLKGEEFRD
jgi:hypothetical protein